MLILNITKSAGKQLLHIASSNNCNNILFYVKQFNYNSKTLLFISI